MSQITIGPRALGATGLLVALILAGPLPASAQQSGSTVTPSASAPATSSSKSSTTQRRARGANGVEQRIADLHTRLKITADQEAQWKQVADVMRQNASDVEAVIKDRSQNAKTMTAVDDLKSYERIAEVHETGMKRLIPAFQTLYDSMSDAQKKNADNVFRAHQRRAASQAS